MEKIRNPKVSVIIPVYNSEKTLKECLISVLNQDYNNYEVILVNNKSTDNTKKIIKEFQKKDKRIIYLFEEKRARGAARYKGELNAKGVIIGMTDSDCVVPNNWISEMIRLIINNKAVAVQGCKHPLIVNYWTKRIQEEKERIIKQRIRDNKVGLLDTANFFIIKDVLKKVGYTNPDIFSGNDTELMARLLLNKYNILYKDFSVGHYHPDNINKVMRKYYKRGQWNTRIIKMYSNDNIFYTTKFTNHITYFFGLCFEFVTLNKNFLFDLVSGISWRIGKLSGCINIKINKNI